MTYKITPFDDRYLEDAARLVAKRYQAFREQVACLPDQYADPHQLSPIIQKISKDNPGGAALQNGQLVGFLTAWRLSSFQGKPAVFSPELAHTALEPDCQRIYDEMYTHLAAEWTTSGYRTHLVSLLANDHAGLAAWHRLGFGMIAADAIRTLDPVPETSMQGSICRAGTADAETILNLDTALDLHLISSPSFLEHESHTLEEVRGWLENPKQAFWIAWDGDNPLAYICFGPASQDASQVIVDEKTTSILAAYTVESARQLGIATTLLNQGLVWAKEQGYLRCAVDFEPTNPLGRRFWLRYFQPVSYSVCRQLF